MPAGCDDRWKGRGRNNGLQRDMSKRTPAGEATLAVMRDALSLSFAVRALGQRYGLVTPWGGGRWGLMRSLHQEGPQAVPQLARARPVARQHIQKLANELEAEGLPEFTDNPRHRRSRLLRLTPRGLREFRRLDGIAHDMAERLRHVAADRDLRHAAQVLESLRAAVLQELDEA